MPLLGWRLEAANDKLFEHEDDRASGECPWHSEEGMARDLPPLPVAGAMRRIAGPPNERGEVLPEAEH